MIRTLAVSIAMVAALVLPAAATAHVEMTPAEAPAGKPVDLRLEVGHGCDGASTTSLVVQIPKGASDVTATAIPGWKATTTPSELRWKGGPLADHDTERFPLRATLSGKKGQVLEFKTIQKCEGGAETAWIQAPEAGGGTEAEHPTPAVTLASTGSAPVDTADPEVQQMADEAANSGQPTATDLPAEETSDSDSDDGGGKSLLLIIVAGLAIGTIAGIIVRSRRMK